MLESARLYFGSLQRALVAHGGMIAAAVRTLVRLVAADEEVTLPGAPRAGYCCFGACDLSVFQASTPEALVNLVVLLLIEVIGWD